MAGQLPIDRARAAKAKDRAAIGRDREKFSEKEAQLREKARAYGDETPGATGARAERAGRERHSHEEEQNADATGTDPQPG
ncbi:MAG TPA: hypothetical protein VNM91_02920 [Dehalococcoidia bacterium]|nr:hypothetical protein [Dehalococcoidia bacterium]